MLRTFILITLLALSVFIEAQETYPVNGTREKDVVYTALVNANVHVDFETRIESCTLLIYEGLINQVGTSLVLPANCVIKDLKGAEVYPGWPLKIVAAEFGWAQGDDALDNTLEGNASTLYFSPAYNIDNLLFKNMIPNIYRQEGSVINAYYARLWGTVKVVDSIAFTPQVLVAFNEQTSNVAVDGGGAIIDSLDSYMATEVEGTITWHIHPGVSFDLIGGVVFAGDSLETMLEAQAASVLAANDINADRINYDETPWTIQGRLMIFIDQFFK